MVIQGASSGVGIMAAKLAWWAGAHQPRLVHIESSEFAAILVFEEFGERCMNFNSMHEQSRQSCFDLDDPAVVRVAQDYSAYEPGPRQRIYIEDGRGFVEHAHASGQRFEIIMLDAFDTDYIPPQLMTVEFFELLRDLMEPDGVLAANSFPISRMYDRESATYAAIFGDFYYLRGTMDANRVIIATKGPMPDQDPLARIAAALSTILAPYCIDTDLSLTLYTRCNTGNRSAPVLRDP